MKIAIIYDNTAWDKRLQAHWGFSCLVSDHGKNILFDTGTNGQILLGNMKKLRIDPKIIDAVFISHDHGDHMGGLIDFLKIHPTLVYIPFSSPSPHGAGEIIKVKGPLEIYKNIYSTGILNGIEQSLVIRHNHNAHVVVGCSHPGVKKILKAGARFGKVRALVGGLHGFKQFALLNPLGKVCPTHCTRYIEHIKRLYPGKYVEGGAGKIIEI